MNCAEFKEHAAAYALGALDAEERAAAEAHLREPRHDGCLDELRRMGDGAHLIAESLPPVRPGAHVWTGIAERIGLAAERAPAAGGRRWREMLAVAVAIAAVVALFFLWRRKGDLERRVAELEGQNVAAVAEAREYQRQANELRGELAKSKIGEVQRSVLALLEQQGTELAEFGPFPNTPPAGYGGNMVMNAAEKRAWFVGRGFKPQPGKTYQLWAVRSARPGDVKAAGTFQPEEGGPAIAAFDPKALDEARFGFAVSLEVNPDDATPEDPLLLSVRPGGIE